MADAVRGDREVATALERLADTVADLPVLQPVAELTRDRLAELGPRLTGALAGSWEVVQDLGRATVGSDLIYAPVQARRFGFVDQAAAEVDPQIEPLVSDELDTLIARYTP